VRNLAHEAFLVVFGDLGYCGVCAHVLLREEVSLFGPEGFELANYRLLVVDESDSFFGYFFREDFLDVEA
jgi:hypothetical protein